MADIICTHWGMVRTARRGVQNMQCYYVNDEFVGTRVADVKTALPDVPLRVLRKVCDDAKWNGSEDFKVEKVDGDWRHAKIAY